MSQPRDKHARRKLNLCTWRTTLVDTVAQCVFTNGSPRHPTSCNARASTCFAPTLESSDHRGGDRRCHVAKSFVKVRSPKHELGWQRIELRRLHRSALLQCHQSRALAEAKEIGAGEASGAFG